ncbi:MAG: hypothetical protein AAF762_01550 [Pseudomonadota bacterium]
MNEVLTVEDQGEAPAFGRDERPIFFMHIAKTAGSYLNARFADALGEDSVAPHIENRVGEAAKVKEMLDAGVRVFSGHVMYEAWKMIAGPHAGRFRKVTILRDPIEHLVSHLLWLDHYNLPEFRSEYRHLDEAHRRVVDEIGSIDLTDVGALDGYLTGLSGTAMRLFDNCQSRYFTTPGRRTMDAIRPMTLADRFAVAGAARDFDAVIFQDDLEAGLIELSGIVGVPLQHSDTRVNSGRASRKIDTSSPLVRQILGRRTLLDQWLWRHLKNEVGAKPVTAHA